MGVGTWLLDERGRAVGIGDERAGSGAGVGVFRGLAWRTTLVGGGVAFDGATDSLRGRLDAAVAVDGGVGPSSTTTEEEPGPLALARDSAGASCCASVDKGTGFVGPALLSTGDSSVVGVPGPSGARGTCMVLDFVTVTGGALTVGDGLIGVDG